MLLPNYISIPSEGAADIANGLFYFGAPSISELLDIASEFGVHFVMIDDDYVQSKWPVERNELRWILNEAADADVFAHF